MYRILLLVLLIPVITFGQLKKKMLPRQITNALDNERIPYVSANGQAMLYLIHDPYKNKWNLHYSRKKAGKWERGEEVLVINKNTNILNRGGYALTPDGNTIYFTTKKYNGVGGYDIFYTKRTGSGDWTTPVSIGKPLNSDQHDANPSVSSDNRTIYFMRCAKLTEGESECCKIMMAERTQGENFKEPVALPAPINTGCESTPRILPDDETLVFASKRAGGKGKLDFYFTQRNGKGKWDNPRNMDFINTAEDDQYLSVNNHTHFFITDLKGEESHDIYKVQFPKEFDPRTVIAIQGKVTDENGQPLNARIQVFDAETRERAHFVSTDKDGNYYVMLTEGHIYDFSILALKGGREFESDIIDLKVLDRYRKERRNAQLKPLTKNRIWALNVADFDDNSQYTALTRKELDRVRKLLRDDPALKLDLLVFKEGLREDTVKAPDLTEVRYDTVMVKRIIQETIQVEKIVDSVVVVVDSLIPKTIDVEQINTYYHNDTRAKNINSLKSYFKKNSLQSRVGYRKIKATDPKYSALIKEMEKSNGVIVRVK